MIGEDLKLLERYETRIRRGFPVGEVKAELFVKGFSEEQANKFMTELYKLSAKKGDERIINFRVIISAVLISLGILTSITTKSKIGLWFIISGIIKIGYDLFFNKKKEL